MTEALTKAPKILIVEDEIEISEYLKIILKQNSYEVVTVADGTGAMNLLANEVFDLILLDWMLPGLSGIEVIHRLRKNGTQTPVVFITAKTQPQDIVDGLEAGADDYLTKPFDGSVLLARIESVLRRYRSHQVARATSPLRKLSFRTLILNLDSFEVSLKSRPLHLTRSEFLILAEMVQNCEKVLTRDQLVAKTQGGGVNVTTRTIDTHVFSLRKKLGDGGAWIETIRGVGYRLAANSPEESR